MATVEFRYDPKNTAWFTANAAMVLKAGEPAYHDTTGLFKLGDGVTALSALSFLPIVSSSTPTIQQVLTTGNVATTTIETTGFIKTGGTSSQFLKADGTVDSSTYLTTLGTAATSLTTTGSSGASTLIANVLNVPNYTLAGLGGTTLAAVNAQNLSVFAATTSSQLAGVISDETGSGSLVFGTSPTFTTSIITPNVTGVSGNLVFTNAAQSSGAITDFTFTAANHTTQTASANIPTVSFTLGTLQRNTGAVTAQHGFLINSPTYSFVGASTITNAYSLFVNAPTVGTNATITNNYAAGFDGNVHMANSTNCRIIFAATNSYIQSASNMRMQGSELFFDTTSWAAVLRVNDRRAIWSFNAVSGGAVEQFTISTAGNFAQTAGTNIPNFRVNGANKQWATGALATQYFNYFTANTVSFVGASTATNVYNLFCESPIAGVNSTITNNYAAGFNGTVNVIGSLYSTGFRLVDGTQALNKVLISDANGNASWATSSTGYAKSINNIAINTTAGATGNTDYYYFCTATLTLTLPTAIGNTNTYNIKLTSGSLTINTTSSQTIDGSLTITTSILNTSFTVISDGTNWQII
jgi:hypothetical protein